MYIETNMRWFLKVATAIRTLLITVNFSCQSEAALEKKREGKDSLIIMESYTLTSAFRKRLGSQHRQKKRLSAISKS